MGHKNWDIRWRRADRRRAKQRWQREWRLEDGESDVMHTFECLVAWNDGHRQIPSHCKHGVWIHPEVALYDWAHREGHL